VTGVVGLLAKVAAIRQVIGMVEDRKQAIGVVEVMMPIVRGETWLNSRPLGPEDQLGNVVLVDFWTYSCVNCLRTLPFLRGWWSRYKDRNFLLVGIHAPEFAFEKEEANVRRAMDEHGVEWPVVLDNSFVNWHNFANHYWPAKYLADTRGKIVYSHFGEGDYGKTEASIRKQLEKDPANLPLPPPSRPEQAMDCARSTPETYCGYIRGSILNEGGYERDTVAEYVSPPRLAMDAIALDGPFIARGQYLQAAGPGSRLMLEFRATEVNLVMASADSGSSARVLLNGTTPSDDERGRDLDGSGLVRAVEPRMYNLIKADHSIEGALEIESLDESLRAYAFTFSGCVPAKAAG
jgi:thiol-disulfide isomerase/thioredoxin